MKNTILKNGIFGGAIMSTIMMSMTLYMKANPGYEPSMVLGFGGMLLAFVFVIIGIKQEREASNGSISFGKAFKTGLLISLVISVLYVVVWLIVYYNFFPDFMERYSEMELKKTKPEDLVAKTAEMNQMKEWYKNPMMVIMLTFMEILPLGIFVSLFGALILKKKQS
jgi:pheromone shutdown protein TraB